jgi:hypothetical protein
MAHTYLQTANNNLPHTRAGTNAETETPRSILGANLELDAEKLAVVDDVS